MIFTVILWRSVVGEWISSTDGSYWVAFCRFVYIQFNAWGLNGWFISTNATILMAQYVAGKLLEVACQMLGAFGQDSHFTTCQWKLKEYFKQG